MLAPAAQQLFIAARARVFVVKAPPSPMQFPEVGRVLEPSAKWLALLQAKGFRVQGSRGTGVV
jgi:hypothetical protein